MEIVERPFLVDLYKENSQNVAVMKCVQVGISEWLLCVLMSKVMQGWSVLYSMPTEGLRNDFIADRLNRLFAIVPLYKQGQDYAMDRDGVKNVGMKHLWNGTAWFAGSNSEVAFISRDADMVIVDELDKSCIKNISYAPDRLKASKYKYFWNVGNPTISKYGIHQKYLESDQRVWMIKCPACNKWQELKFFKNVVREVSEGEYELIDKNYAVVCNKCASPLNRLGEGNWVAKRDSSTSASVGYHISQLFSPTVSIQEIYQAFLAGLLNATKMQVFYNSILGLPYEAAGSKLSESILDNHCVDDYVMPSSCSSNCTAGIDVNYPELNVRISSYEDGKRRAVFIGKVMKFDELNDLIKRYNVKHLVIDVAPERHKVDEFIAKYNKSSDKYFACQYTSTTNAEPLIKSIKRAFDKSNEQSRITVDRTTVIDAMITDILSGNNKIPKNYKQIDNGDYLEQLEAPARLLDESKNPPRYVWDEKGLPDHYFHAEVYDYIAMMIMNERVNRIPRVITIG